MIGPLLLLVLCVCVCMRVCGLFLVFPSVGARVRQIFPLIHPSDGDRPAVATSSVRVRMYACVRDLPCISLRPCTCFFPLWKEVIWPKTAGKSRRSSCLDCHKIVRRERFAACSAHVAASSSHHCVVSEGRRYVVLLVVRVSQSYSDAHMSFDCSRLHLSDSPMRTLRSSPGTAYRFGA